MSCTHVFPRTIWIDTIVSDLTTLKQYRVHLKDNRPPDTVVPLKWLFLNRVLRVSRRRIGGRILAQIIRRFTVYIVLVRFEESLWIIPTCILSWYGRFASDSGVAKFIHPTTREVNLWNVMSLLFNNIIYLSAYFE